MTNKRTKGRVLYVGQAYYNAWYLSQELKKINWRADLLNFDQSEHDQMYYHGENYRFLYRGKEDVLEHLRFYTEAIVNYDIFHFSNARGLYFLNEFDSENNNIHKTIWFAILRSIVFTIMGFVCRWKPKNVYKLFNIIGFRSILFLLIHNKRYLPERWDIKLLKKMGKKIVYSNNGCLDGVSQTSFSKWGPLSTCDICRWKNEPTMCSDARNLKWGKLRNELADYQILLGGNRADYNIDSHIHEVPEFYCLDSQFWKPNLTIPTKYKLNINQSTVKIYHAVGNSKTRTTENNMNIKCSHIYIPLIKALKKEGYSVEMVSPDEVPNKVIRYYQAQSDIVVDMLTFGWFGATIREAMMLGKPCVCYIRPEWLESMKSEIPDYVKELPIVNATPQTIRKVLIDLITNKKKRQEIGKRSREFAVKWHSSKNAAKRFDTIYSQLLSLNTI